MDVGDVNDQLVLYLLQSKESVKDGKRCVIITLKKTIIINASSVLQ